MKRLNLICLYCGLLFSSYLFAQPAPDEEESWSDTVVVEAPAIRPTNDSMPSFDAHPEVLKTTVRTVPKQKIDELKNSEDYWYANTEREKKKERLEKVKEAPFKRSFIQNLLWGLILVSFIAVVVWYLISSNIFLYRKSAKRIDEERASDESEDIFSLSYEREINKAEESGNYRLAVRLFYLQLLKILSEKQLIEYRIGRTNGFYVTQLAGTPHYKTFFSLTRHFDYVWYGQFPLTADEYNNLRTRFHQFSKEVAP